MIDDLILATGANPNYDPQMVESILVQRLEGLRGSRLFDPNGIISTAPMALMKSSGYVSYKVLWTDSQGHHHGRLWSYSRAFIETNCDGHLYPLVCAATQAGCVWVHRSSTEEFAEIQAASGRNPRITIEALGEDIEGAEQEVLDRMILGLPLRWQAIPYSDPENHPWEFWFGDDLDDDEPELFMACGDSSELGARRRATP